jgi:hypothetical protein
MGSYLAAVEGAFAGEIDYAQIIKLYGRDPAHADTPYGPAECIGTERRVVAGDPDPGLISTSYVERQDLTMRMGMRRMTRLTNASPRRSRTLPPPSACTSCTPTSLGSTRALGPYPRTQAMAAGVADHVWTLQEIAALPK